MCDYIDAACDVWVETPRKARRKHFCTECRLPILAGSKYVDVRSLYDGRWTTTRAHPLCVALVKHVAFNVCGQSLYVLDSDSSIRDRVKEHYHEAPELLRMYRHAIKAAERGA